MNLLLAAFGYFAVLTGIFLTKLLPFWNQRIPGGLQDTRLFLWNAWWFHHAITVLHTNPYYTTLLFHPFGTSLISHDYPLWMNLVTFVAQRGGASIIAACNYWFAISWMLSGFCSFGLVYEVTHEPAPAFVAGTFVMTHSYTLARAMQNWGQFNLYAIALFLWMLVRARRRNTWGGFAWAGAALAWTAACHYYFLIYCTLIWLVTVVVDIYPCSMKVRWHWSMRGPLRKALCIIAITAGAIGVASVIHPTILSVGPWTIGLLSGENPLFVMWLLWMVFAGMNTSITQLKRARADSVRLKHHLVLAGTAAVLLSPLLYSTVKLIRMGGYPKQNIQWKTHPRGADLFSLFMPNPLHPLWGPYVSHWFTERGMMAQDQAASIGWVCLAVFFFSRVWRENHSARKWLAVALAATVFSLGTHLHLAQYNLWCPLPFFWLRLLPIIGNVRIPERWMSVGAIAWSVVLAWALIRLSKKYTWPLRNLSAAAIALILVENWPGLPFASTPPVSPVYAALKRLPPGAVLALPFYIGDSSIGAGDTIGTEFSFPWDHLWAQSFHEKPILGGYIGRISHQVIQRYKANPFTLHLLDLEEHKISGPLSEPEIGLAAAHDLNFRYVLIYSRSTDPEAVQYVLKSLPLELLASDDSIQLYRVKG